MSSTTTSHKRPDYAPGTDDRDVEGTAGGGSIPAPDDASERIAFVKGGTIWLMKPDGSQPRRISSRQPGTADESPQISPFGDQVVFASTREGGVSKIFVAPVDGTNARAVTDGSFGGDRHPSWSPDGSRVVFVRGHEGERRDLFTVVAAGEHPHKPDLLVQGNDADPHDVGWPVYSPDGKQIVFAADRNEGTGTVLWIVDVGGTGLRRLTRHGRPLPWLRDLRPSFAPDGKRIVFASNRHAAREADAADLDVYALDVASGSITRLTHDPAVADDPSVSPDGKRIYFVSTRDAARPYSSEIYVMPAAGGDQRRVTRDEVPENSAPSAGRVP